jgi:UDPglucose 6-dehydrogenase
MSRFRKEHADLDVVLASDACEVARDADAVVLITEWPQYLELDWESLASVMRTPIMLDTRHALDRGRITRAGFRYLALA